MDPFHQKSHDSVFSDFPKEGGNRHFDHNGWKREECQICSHFLSHCIRNAAALTGFLKCNASVTKYSVIN